MKTIAVTFLLISLALNQSSLGQLLKLPVLVDHFYKHQKEENLSLVEFLSEHYASGHEDEDQAEDNQLPFKSGTVQEVSSAVIAESMSTDFASGETAPVKIDFRVLHIPQQHLQSIFRPPRG
jgi:hypothetical protein